jgi:hypothetical protein
MNVPRARSEAETRTLSRSGSHVEAASVPLRGYESSMSSIIVYGTRAGSNRMTGKRCVTWRWPRRRSGVMGVLGLGRRRWTAVTASTACSQRFAPVLTSRSTLDNLWVKCSASSRGIAYALGGMVPLVRPLSTEGRRLRSSAESPPKDDLVRARPRRRHRSGCSSDPAHPSFSRRIVAGGKSRLELEMSSETEATTSSGTRYGIARRPSPSECSVCLDAAATERVTRAPRRPLDAPLHV